MKMTFDNREDRRANLQTVDSPRWYEVEEAVRRLDAKRHTEVTVGNGSYISVGGGNGQYFVFIYTEDERNLIVTDPARQDGEGLLVSGGQSGRYPARHIVGLTEALKAVRTYFERGNADQSLRWTED